jgi:hypothetical protein
MSRNRTAKICPKCNKPCYFEEKPTRNNKKGDKTYRYYWYAIHYDSITGKRTSCCIDKFVNRTRKIRRDESDPTQPISDERLKELLDSPYDRIETIVEYGLNDEQMKLLSQEDLKRYFKIHMKIIREDAKKNGDFIKKMILDLTINQRPKRTR